MSENAISSELTGAIAKIRAFIETVTGEPAGDAEIAQALTRYFVLNEIAGHIQMARENQNIVTE